MFYMNIELNQILNVNCKQMWKTHETNEKKKKNTNLKFNFAKIYKIFPATFLKENFGILYKKNILKTFF